VFKNTKYFDIGFVCCDHELFHVVSECNPIYLTIYMYINLKCHSLLIMFLVGLKDELVVELDDL
jgi:hypothetical protein